MRSEPLAFGDTRSADPEIARVRRGADGTLEYRQENGKLVVSARR
jgi:hypothetical protein